MHQTTSHKFSYSWPTLITYQITYVYGHFLLHSIRTNRFTPIFSRNTYFQKKLDDEIPFSYHDFSCFIFASKEILYNGPTYFHQQVEKCSALHFFLLNIDILSLLCVIMSITPIELFLDYCFFSFKGLLCRSRYENPCRKHFYLNLFEKPAQ